VHRDRTDDCSVGAFAVKPRACGAPLCGFGALRAVRVKLQNGGAVEGDIFHRSLAIDENSLFEGSARRVENPTEASSSADTKWRQKDTEMPAAVPVPLIDADLQPVEESVPTEWSESAVAPKH
jgi:hypothetical protein